MVYVVSVSFYRDKKYKYKYMHFHRHALHHAKHCRDREEEERRGERPSPQNIEKK